MADDIVVFGKDGAEHRERLMKVMDRLSECGLTLNASKCQFGVSSLKFLGHVLSSDGVSPDPDKVQSVLRARAPTTVSELKGFLGLVQFVGRYVPNLATVSAPLWSLTKKSVPFQWTKRHEEAFAKVKGLLSSSKTLAYFDKDAPTTLIADASPVGLGGVLYQVQNGVSKVVAYGHRSLTDVESRYSQIEREALALIWSCEHFKMYLLGRDFQLIPDHKPLVLIFNNSCSKPTPRLERWSLRLQAFNFVLSYCPGCHNIADSMSRLSISDSDKAEPLTDDSYAFMVAEQSVPVAMSWLEVQEAVKDCKETELILRAIQSGDWHSYPAAFKAVRSELSSCDGVVLRGNRIFVPVSLRERVLFLAHEGHQGIVKTKKRLCLKVWWPGMDKEAEILCRQCLSCQLVSQSDPPTPIVPTKMPDGPWKFCSVDLLGPLPDGRSVVVIVDYFSRLFEAKFLKSTKAEKVIMFLEDVFSRYGFPELLRSDNGPQFVSGEFQAFLSQSGVKWISTTPLWPQANGEVERMNRTILKVLKIAKSENKDLQKALREFTVAYSSTPHTATGMTPLALMFGRETRTKLPMLSNELSGTAAEAHDCDAVHKQKMKDYTDRRSKDSEVQKGDAVLLRQENRGKLDTNYGPEKHTVVGLEGSDMVCSGPSGSMIRRNVSCAKKIQASESSPVVSSDANNSSEIVSSPVVPEVSPPVRVGLRQRKLSSKYQDYKIY